MYTIGVHNSELLVYPQLTFTNTKKFMNSTKHFLYLTLAFLLLNVAQTSAAYYTISFTGTGVSTKLDSVVIQNLTKGTQVTVPEGNVLLLTSSFPTNMSNTPHDNRSINIIPNPIQNSAIVEFPVYNDGEATVAVFTMNGTLLTYRTLFLQAGMNAFQLALPRGTFLINVKGTGYNFTSKAMSVNGEVNQPTIDFARNEILNEQTSKIQKVSASSTTNITTMTYDDGDQLVYKCYSSGKYETITTDVPMASKSVSFNLLDCKDADGNQYTTVVIGSQTWLAQNLRTTKFQNGDPIPSVTDDTQWNSLSTPAQCTYNNTTSVDSITQNGRLYNWYAVSDSRNIAPTGWHVATDEDWTVLTNYVDANYGISLNSAKALASNQGWVTFPMEGTVGSNLNQNNSTGFNATPCGVRYMDGAEGSTGTGFFCKWWAVSGFGGESVLDREMYFYHNSIVTRTVNTLQSGLSVRCVKD
jgi:uncharacterized protein (TIGR02145 family)